ncbi:DUF4429 domain-containing protein [Spongiactinospora sp. TRM90649]|uniref:DUF4429 domain-containing protein n=1 Tax=Spongiactinospora sp. TRM90649 TaxID=3031114 RepID=UPI0023F70478|nr:DUF4429 domain-containing protein [Spongiactinospora sp. TRM90649]MDF5756432.1 DUF4429 domain-containing protein [Spongiactinospora sp. TRM90649]
MSDVLSGRKSEWIFEPDRLRIRPAASAPKVLRALGEREVPYRAVAEISVVPGGRGTVLLRLTPRPGACPITTVAAGQLKPQHLPYSLVLPAERRTLAEYYAEEMTTGLSETGPADSFLIPGPDVPRGFKAWDGAASFDGENVTFKWFWSGATTRKFNTGDQRYRITDIEGVEWFAPTAGSGSLRLRVRGQEREPDAAKDPASVIFGLGYGATHMSLPFAAAVLSRVTRA